MHSPAEKVVAAEFGRWLAERGLNVLGEVRSLEFDRTQPFGRRARELSPTCETILVAGSGGSGFWRLHAEDANGRPGSSLDSRARAVCAEALRRLASAGIGARPVFPAERRTLNFVQLAEMAGIGTVSPVSGWLLHPQYGPWLSFGFALLIDGEPFVTPLPRAVGEEFQPCLGCDQRCVKACPAEACRDGMQFAAERCATHRHGGGCRTGCEMQRACPCGAEHRYVPEEEEYRHARGLHALQRVHGLGWWQLMPTWLRQRLPSP